MMYMAIDQYGNTHHGLRHPRKDLCELLGRKHAEKMYVDHRDSSRPPRHCGYVIAGLWLKVFEVRPWHSVEGGHDATPG